MKEYICIDIGGTSIKHGVVREDGTFAVTGEMPTQAMEYGGPGIMEKQRRSLKFTGKSISRKESAFPQPEW